MDEAAPQAAKGCGGPMKLGHKSQMEWRHVPVALAAAVPDLSAGSTP
jgi:hypothetical protein